MLAETEVSDDDLPGDSVQHQIAKLQVPMHHILLMKTVHHRDNVVEDGEGVSLSKLLLGDHIVLQVDEVSRVGAIVLRRDTIQHQTHTAH